MHSRERTGRRIYLNAGSCAELTVPDKQKEIAVCYVGISGIEFPIFRSEKGYVSEQEVQRK